MFEMDKTSFGKFLAEQRKSKGYTQKMLAEKLYVSDKAVSKWERGLSMPDISLLIPLSAILEVSVTELLEGRNPNSIRVCTLFDKPDRREVDVQASYVGSVIPDAFIVGYGLDYAEKYRNLPFVGVLKPQVYE